MSHYFGRLLFPIVITAVCAVSTNAQNSPDKGRAIRHSRLRLPDFDVRRDGVGSPLSAAERVAGPRVVLPAEPKSVAREAVSLDAVETARHFLRTEAGTGEYRLLRRVDMEGQAILDFQQEISGVPVFEGNVKVAVDAAGVPAAMTRPERTPRILVPAAPRIGAEEAVRRAYAVASADPPARLEPATSEVSGNAFLNPLGEGTNPVLADLVAFPVTSETTRLAWQVYLDLAHGASYQVVIDAGDGSLLFRHDLLRESGSAKVWKIAPDKGDRETVALPDSWLPTGATATTGNNADAYVDSDGDDKPDSLPDTGVRNGRAYSENQFFEFSAPVAGAAGDPRAYKAASITNAFYFVNAAHDYFYGLGFTEDSGNFQKDNGTRGGKGGDAVLVEVQDLYYSNEAVMGITRDGVAPRMQIGIYTAGTSKTYDDRDIAYDGQTVIHEYSHGVTNRLVGGGASTSCLAGTQSMALDEGWADYFASSYFNDPVQSSWLSADAARGIRRHSYEGYTLTYEDFANEGAESHRDGELWAAALWDLRKTLGQTAADKLVIRGLALTPCRPSFIDARDAILAADKALNNSANRARIYEVFARHGMGASASGYDATDDLMTVFNAAYDLPADLQTGTSNHYPAVTSQPSGFAVAGESFVYQIQATDPDGDTLTYELSKGPQGLTVDSRTGLVKWVAAFMSQAAKIVVTDNRGGRVIHGIYIRVLSPLTAGRPITIAMPAGQFGMASLQVPGGSTVLQATLRGSKGDADLTLLGPDGLVYAETGRTGSYETISVAEPTAGRWFIIAYAYSAVEELQLAASLPEPKLISGNAKYPALDADQSSETFYRVVVPQGTSQMIFTTEGVRGDVDLVLQRGRVPVCQVYDDYYSNRCDISSGYYSFRYGNTDSVSVGSPQSGNWYLNLATSSGYAGVTLTSKMDVRPTLIASVNALTFNVLEGGAAPAAQSVQISNPSGSSFAWIAALDSGAGWLRLDKTSGTGDATLAVSVAPQTLGAGTYTASITIQSSGLSGSPQTIKVTLNVTQRPVIKAGASELVFTGPAGQDPAVQRLQLSNAGGGTFEWTVTVATASGGAWLAVDQARGTGSANLQVVVSAGNLSVGAYEGTITIAATNASSITVKVRYSVTIAFQVAENSLRNVASMRDGAVSPGAMLMLQGTNLISACSTEAGAVNPCPSAAGYPLPTELGSTRVTVNGVAAPLISVTPTEIRFIVPYELEGTSAKIVVERQGTSSSPIVRELAAQSLGIFSMLGNGVGAAQFYHSDDTPVTRAAPLQAEETVNLLAGGLGAVAPAVVSGAAAPSDPKAEPVVPVKVFLDGQECTPKAAFLEPGTAGVYRIRVAVPAGLPRKYPVVAIQSAISASNETSAGGPSLLDVTPATAARGTDVTVTLRGINLPEGAAVKIGDESIAAELTGGGMQSLKAIIPARLLESAAELQLIVVDPAAPGEAPSNAVVLRLR